MRTGRKTERGIALLATMMGIALMTITVMDFTSSAMLGYRAAANQANELRAAYLARSGVNVGLALLAQHSRQQVNQTEPPVEALNQEWSMPYPAIPVGGGTASVSIVDEERKLDINYLVNQADGTQNSAFEPILERLFVTIGVSIDLIPAIIDWLDPDSIPDGPTGAEADYNMRLFPPYAPRNGPMPSIGDLRMIRGVDDQTFMKLSRVLTVFSDTAPNADNKLPQVNVYTAPPEVLVSLAPDLAASPSMLDQWLAARLESQSDALAGTITAMGQGSFNTRSNLFTIEGRGSYAGARKLVFATVVHPNGNGPSQILQWHED